MTRPLDVRRADLADVDAIHAVLVEAFEPLRDQYTKGAFDATVLDPGRISRRLGEGPVWLATHGSTPVGTFGCRDDSGGHYLRGMGVTPSARGLGVGRGLLQTALNHVEASPVRFAWLYTTPFLHAAISLYRSAGFVEFTEDPPPDLFGTKLVGMRLEAP